MSGVSIKALSTLVCLAASAAALPTGSDPLHCFISEPASRKLPNTCFGQYPYQFPQISSPDACAAQCLRDNACVQFVWALPGEHGATCRLSHTCVQPSGFLAGFDGYLRTNSSGCEAGPVHHTLSFHAPLFADGMILQRDTGAQVWGEGAVPGATVTVSVTDSTDPTGSSQSVPVDSVADSTGSWRVTVTHPSSRSVTLVVSDGTNNAKLDDVAFGDVLLCGGQSNMGFGMCGAHSKNQTPQQALDSLSPNVRFFFQQGSGPYGGRGGCKTSDGQDSVTMGLNWFKANSTNSGGASAVCMLTAQYLSKSLGHNVPVGAVESCVSGTNVEPWTPPNGSLYLQNIVPLIPMSFKFALWDQGEADAKRTSSAYYITEFPKLILGWRDAFDTPTLPFFYVELCTEYGAEEPKESSFWAAQRSALELPQTGFAVTTDIQRALHPPDKQDVAQRLLLEVLRVVYGKRVVSRGPELVSHSLSSINSTEAQLTLNFSNSSLVMHEGILVGTANMCTSVAFQQQQGTQRVSLPFKISGSQVIVTCKPSGSPNTSLVLVNSDSADCFLYSSESSLPAPPIEIPCL